MIHEKESRNYHNIFWQSFYGSKRLKKEMTLRQAILFLSISFVAISCHDQNLKWDLPLLTTAFKNQPTLSENYICFQTDSFIRICDKKNGELIHSIPVANPQLLKTLFRGNMLYVISDSIFAFNVAQNKFLWKINAAQFTDTTMLDSFPATLQYNNAITRAFICDSILLFGNSLGFYALSAQTGKEVWKKNYYSASTAYQSALTSGNLFLIRDSNAVAVDPFTGKEKWTCKVTGFTPTNLVTSGDTLIIGRRHARSFLVVRSTDGALLKEYKYRG